MGEGREICSFFKTEKEKCSVKCVLVWTCVPVAQASLLLGKKTYLFIH